MSKKKKKRMLLSQYPKVKSSLSLFVPKHKPKLLNEIASSMQNILKPLELSVQKNNLCVDTKMMPIEQMDSFQSSRPDFRFIMATRSLQLPNLPALPKTSDPNYKSIFLQKIKLCTSICDFENPNNDLTAKKIKEQTLQEIVNSFIQLGFNTYTDSEIQEKMYEMVMINLKRKQKPFELNLFFNADSSSYKSNDWPHILYMYKILINMLKAFPHFHAWNLDFIFELVPLLSSKDTNERDQLVAIFMMYMTGRPHDGPAILKKIDTILLDHRELNPDPCGVYSVLSIITMAVNSNPQMYMDYFTSIFKTQILLLLADQYLSIYQDPLCHAIKIMIVNDQHSVKAILQTLINYWPIMKPDKEEISLSILARGLRYFHAKSDSFLLSRIIGIVGTCANNAKYTIAEEANKLIQTPAFIDLLAVDSNKYIPIIMQHLENATFHWSKSVRDLATSAIKFVNKMNPKSTLQREESRLNLCQTSNDFWVMTARKAAKNDKTIKLGDKLMEISYLFNKATQNYQHQAEIPIYQSKLLHQQSAKITKPQLQRKYSAVLH